MGPKVLERKRKNDRKETKVPEMRMALTTPKYFENVVVGTGIRISEDVVRFRVGKDEIRGN